MHFPKNGFPKQTLRNFVRYFASDSGSCLYVRHSPSAFSVEPNLDFSRRLCNLRNVQELLRQRGVYVPEEELYKLNQDYECWKRLSTELEVVNSKVEAGDKELIPEKVALRDQLKDLTPVILKCLKLPNDISDDTPTGGENRLLETVNSRQSKPNVSHMDFLQQQELVAWKNNPAAIFLLGEAAELQMTLLNLIQRRFSDAEFTMITAPHFVRKSITEGCCVMEPGDLFEVESGVAEADETVALQLVGSSSAALVAVFCRKIVTSALAKVFSVGTLYRPPVPIIDLSAGLFRAPQRLGITALAICSSCAEAAAVSNEIKFLILKIVDTFGISISAEQVCAESLSPAEEGRICFRCSDKEATLAHISSYGTYISERLRIYKKHWDLLPEPFAHIVSAEVDVSSVFAALIETHCDYGLGPLDKLLCRSN